MTGVVKEMRTVHSTTNTGGRRGHTIVNVEFTVSGKTYTCRELWFFRGNSHVGDVGTVYDFDPGREVGLYYDPADPTLCALIVDRPSHFHHWWAFACGVMFTAMTVLAWRQLGP